MYFLLHNQYIRNHFSFSFYMVLSQMATNTQITHPSSSPTFYSTSSAHVSFPIKLNPKNYLAWKTQLFPLINSQNLGFIDGTTPPPSTNYFGYY